jgi:biopolymer transport protein TolQ
MYDILLLAPLAQTSGLDLWSIIAGAHIVSKVVFTLLLLGSVWSVAVMFERALLLARLGRSVLEGQVMLDAAAKPDAAGRPELLTRIRAANREDEPLFSVLRSGLIAWDELRAVGEKRLEVLEAMMREAMGRELKMVRAGLRANLPVLANVASSAPFVGLFGTVIGIILTFDTMARQQNMGRELVGSGIADALIATAMGLFAAIPAVIAYNVLTDRINQAVLAIEEAAMERVYFLVDRNL